MNTKVVLIVIVLAVAIVGGLLWYSRQSTPTPTDTGDASGLIVDANAIYVADQEPGTTVSVEVARLEKPGFVSIHEDADGEPGTILGTSSLLPTGDNENVGPITLSRTTTDGETLYAVIRLDDGDGRFDATKDTAALDSTTGEPISMLFYAVADATEPDAVSL